VRSWDSPGVRLEVPVGVFPGKGVCTSSSGDGLGKTGAQEERRRNKKINIRYFPIYLFCKFTQGIL